tara:strand:+ start:3587 stop:4531 length:945 start_codon:yes stop_codon:yes gene_type:complete
MGRKQRNKLLLDKLKVCLLSGDFSRSDNELIIKCPFCSDEKGHCYVNCQKKVSFCFKCRTSTQFKTSLQGHTVKSLLYAYGKKQGNKVFAYDNPIMPETAFVSIMSIVGEEPRASIGSAVRIERAYDYCIKRRLTIRQIQQYRISVKPFDSRVYFPVWNEEEKITFYMGRTTINQIPKTIEMKNSSKPLYGRHIEKVQGDTVILVEGVFDHFATPKSYALMGIHITRSQIKTLRDDDVKRVFVVGDPDSSKLSVGVSRLLLANHIQAFPVQLIGTKLDPADLGRKIMSKLVDKLVSLPETKRSTIIRISIYSDD